MLAAGGRTLEDLRVLRHDEGLRSLLQLEEMPSRDAMGDWLRRLGGKESGLAGLQRVNRGVFRRLLPSEDRTAYTLDIDATQIVAQKREAHYTYKGQKGYIPMARPGSPVLSANARAATTPPHPPAKTPIRSRDVELP